MSSKEPQLARIVLIPVMILGLFLLVDGILPTRSAPPNPSWLEIIIGTICLGSSIISFIVIGKKIESDKTKNN